MAVYTSLNKYEVKEFLKNYDIGSLISFNEIVEGIENSNFYIITDKGKFILTIFEKRVDIKDLPFFVDLQKHLSSNNFKCPVPLENNSQKIINSLKNKRAIISSFLEGNKITDPEPNHCLQVGKMISYFQKITQNFNFSRKNGLNINKWNDIFLKCSDKNNGSYKELLNLIKNELLYLKINWPTNLPSGVIHADIFKDNVLFENNKLSGLIDFYFSCNEFYSYELAMTTNAWCFNASNEFIKENFESLFNGYLLYSKFNDMEKRHFNTLLRGAALRILVTRLHDKLFEPENATFISKDPFQYSDILKWHQLNSVFDK